MNDSKKNLANKAQWTVWENAGAVTGPARRDVERLLLETVQIDSIALNYNGRDFVGLGKFVDSNGSYSPAVVVRVPNADNLRIGQTVQKRDMPKGMVAISTRLPR